MGTWGAGSFENDEASDWAADLIDGGDVAMIRDTLATAARCPGDEYLETDEGATALAAGEVVAAAAGRPLRKLSLGGSGEEALAWASAYPAAGTVALVELAEVALERVAAGESELHERWAGDADAREWFAAVEDLRTRLAG